MQPLISVIVPVYNTRHFLGICVESILNQTYNNLEVILVDDGSVDGSAELCDQYAEKDKRIRVCHKENGGVSTARNTGLEQAKGAYIAFVDSDDYMEPDMYEKMMNVALEKDSDVVMCDCVKEFSACTEIYTHNIRGGDYNRTQLENEYFPHLLIMENVEYPATISNGTLLWKSTLNTEDMRYVDGIRFSEDLLFGAKLLYKANSFYYMKGEAYYHYVMRQDSASHTYVPDKWKDYQLLHSEIAETFSNVAEFRVAYQVNLCLLFFVYNAVGDIWKSKLTDAEKKEKILNILNTPTVVSMFKQININKLQISVKQKVLTMMYKYRIGISLLIKYYGE